jgi:HipA-like kinase
MRQAVPVQHLERVAATRYVTPLREGGSLPALVEADDDGLYVLKFRGAGQGRKALVAEIVAGEVARALGLLVPRLALVELDPALGRAEPDPEIQDLLVASAGLNLGVDFLPASLPYSPAVGPAPDADLAAAVVWFDALVTNIDRTAQNPNLLLWHDRLWLIDHGAALYFHHTAERDPAHARTPFPAIREHVLIPFAGSIRAADERLAPHVTEAVLSEVTAAVPDEWLDGDDRRSYVDYLLERLEAPRAFVEEAERARVER